MTRLSPGQRWLLAILGSAALIVIVSHELIASPMLITSAVRDGVTGFACRDLLVDTPSGSWSRHSHIMRGALRMPRPCLADLRQHVQSSPEFHAEQCNVVEQCWTRTDAGRSYTFTFYPDYAAVHFESR
jgi:hypothetical protein